MNTALNNSVLPTHPAGSVPLDDENKQNLDQARRSFETSRDAIGDSLSKFLLRIRKDINDLDREKRLTHFRKMIKAHQYMDGNFYGYVDQNCEWQTRPREDGEIWYQDNQLYPYLRTALMEMSRTQTEVVIEAPNGAGEEMEMAAKFAKARYDANRDRTFNARLKQTENCYALLNGITYRYTFLQFQNGRPEQMPTVQQQDPDGDGSGEGGGESADLCGMCGRPKIDMPEIGDTKAEPRCPNCGSEYFIKVNTSDKPDTVIGYKDVPTCENAWIVPNPVGVIISLNASCIQETPFIDWKQLVLRAILEDKYTGIQLPSTGVESTELRYISTQQKAVPAESIAGRGYDSGRSTGNGEKELELLELHQTWLDYSLYCNKTFEEDMPLGRGEVLKAGDSLGEMFPDGCYFASVGDIVLDIWNEDKNRKWTSSPYGIRPGSMYGSGSAIALTDQELLNDLQSLKLANAWSNGVPLQVVDPDYIKEISTDPYIPTNLSKPMPDGSSTIDGRVIAFIAPPPLSAEVYGLSEKAESSMQNKVGALSGTGAGGLADAQKWGDTATAISIKRDLAVGRFSPDLMLMADQLDREQAIQFLENEQQFFTQKQWQRHKGDYGEEALEAFLKCDIRSDLLVTIQPGSYMPKSDAQVQAKFIQFAQLMPELAQIGNPELIAYAAETFGVPEYLAGWNSERVYARRVVDRLEALAEVFVQQYGDLMATDLDDPNVMMVAQKINDYSGMPVDVFLDNHDALVDSFRDWRSTDDGRNASNACLAAVSLRLTMHQMGKAKQAQLAAGGQVVANKPLQDAMNQQQQGQMQDEREAQQQQASQQQEAQQPAQIAEGLGKVLEFDDRDKQRQHEMELAQMQAQQEPEKHPAQHIAETMSYKDLPPSVQRQMEEAAGFTPATAQETKNQVANIAPPKKVGAAK